MQQQPKWRQSGASDPREREGGVRYDHIVTHANDGNKISISDEGRRCRKVAVGINLSADISEISKLLSFE